ncbi:CsoS2 family carboxysome shell protein [Thiocystis violacea]|uniref:CsoS2 family carboxysome shell protein n=1 Tax=Thiocystis violacea TaxID=13725 RepID=UPI0019058EE9|nr:CsoS2 family carboxysome shell protein [Thiocystis violacea]MBK1723050.1 carboxysome shell protein [Thiocystis violacea]
MDKAGSERGLTGREASIAKRRAIAAGGKTQGAGSAPNPRAGARAERKPEHRPERAEAARADSAPTPSPPAPRAERPRKSDRNRQPAVGQGRARSMQRRERLTRGKSAAQVTSKGDLGADTRGLAGREAAIARRRAISGMEAPAPRASRSTPATEEARHLTMEPAKDRALTSERRVRSGRPRTANGKKAAASRGRLLSMARRAAMADRGRSGVEAMGGRSRNAATTSLMRNAGVSSREIAKRVREERCEHGKCGDTGPRPSGRTRRQTRAESDPAPAKVGLSETASGQQVTGTKVGRGRRTTGDEPGACRAVTGTEYMGAEVFQEFCGQGPVAAPGRQAAATLTNQGQTLTGAQVGRSTKVTGDETGAGRQLTGTPYTAPGPEGAPPKVRQTQTLSGQSVTGSMIGRRERVTGNEAGTCQRVTGNEYLGSEHFQGHCKTSPEPFGGKKVGVDATWHGQQVTGSQIGRSQRVTGDEPGACEIVTGTAYLGAGPVLAHCGPEIAQAMTESAPARHGTPGAGLTGIQPGIGGVMSGAAKGACQSVTGTPYLGQDQFFAACGEGSAATPGSADFPQPLNGGNWRAFSVNTPARSAQGRTDERRVTGTAYDETRSRITGPFNMAGGVVTGTNDFRLRRSGGADPHPGGASPMAMALAMEPAVPAMTAPEQPAEEPRPRITGEGMDGGTRITGDDWGRNERVTGTEGTSAFGRNPTRRGTPMEAFAGARAYRDAQARKAPELQITGSSGSTDRGALVTLSGGARG